MSYVLGELGKLFPSGLNGVKIAFNDCSAPVRELAVKLFDLGAVIIVADKDANNVSALNRVLFPRSGSLTRYKAVSFSTIHLEVVDAIIEISELPEGPLHAKNRIRPKAKAVPAKVEELPK